MSKAANEIDGQDAGKMVPAIPRQHMPLFTNFDRKWELDHLEIGHYRASIFYIQTNTLYNIEKPYFLNIPVDPEWYPTVKQTNVAYTRKSVDITDIRGHGDVFSLDIQGFALANLQTNLSYSDFTSSDTIVNRYYKEVQEFLKTFTGAAEVLPFDFQVITLAVLHS